MNIYGSIDLDKLEALLKSRDETNAVIDLIGALRFVQGQRRKMEEEWRTEAAEARKVIASTLTPILKGAQRCYAHHNWWATHFYINQVGLVYVCRKCSEAVQRGAVGSVGNRPPSLEALNQKYSDLLTAIQKAIT